MTETPTGTLTETWLEEVARRLPARVRGDVVDGLRTAVADRIHDAAARGVPAPEAERRALEELGDPARLAEDHAPGPRHLIGPAHYHEFLELLRVLVPVLAGVFGGLSLLGTLFAEAGRQDPVAYAALALASALGAALQGALMGAGAAVVVFAVVERVESTRTAGRAASADAPAEAAGSRRSGTEEEPARWTVEQLPPPRPPRDVTVGELVWSSLGLALAFAAPFLLSRPLFAHGPLAGEPLLAPGLWWPWVPLYLGLVAVSWGWELLRFLRRRWSWGLWAVNAAVDLAMAALLVTVLRTESVVNPVLRERGWVGEGFAAAGVVLVVVITVWDLVATFLACRHSLARRRGAGGG